MQYNKRMHVKGDSRYFLMLTEELLRLARPPRLGASGDQGPEAPNLQAKIRSLKPKTSRNRNRRPINSASCPAF